MHISIADCEFAVLDVETSGFSPKQNRILEIAIVGFHPSLGPTWEYSTLVNSGGDVGPTWVHGITTDDLVNAPRFSEIAGDVISRLRGRVLVGHNVHFDVRFLAAEYARLGRELKDIPTVCTMQLVRDHGLEPDCGRRLDQCCRHLSIPRQGSHWGLGDARATARLFEICLRKGAGIAELADLGCCFPPLPPDFWMDLSCEGQVWNRAPRDHTAKSPRLKPISLAKGVDQYRALLYENLKDGELTDGEAYTLVDAANRLQIPDLQLVDLHLEYLDALIATAMEDKVVTEEERTFIFQIGGLLHLDRGIVEALIKTRG